MLVPPHTRELTDDELAALLREAMTGARGLGRPADTFLATQCAEYLVDRLRLAGCMVSVIEEPPRGA